MADPMVLGLLSSVFRGMRTDALLASLTMLITIGEAHQIDIRERLRPVIAALPGPDAGLLREALGISSDELLREPAASRDEEIGRLYAELRGLAVSADPADEARYRERLARLRELQEAEVRDMDAAFEANRLLPRGAVDADLARVDALLGEDDVSPVSDHPRDDDA